MPKEPIYEFFCPMCGGTLWARYHNLEKLEDLVKFHLKQEHQHTPTPDELRSMIMVVQPLPPLKHVEA